MSKEEADHAFNELMAALQERCLHLTNKVYAATTPEEEEAVKQEVRELITEVETLIHLLQERLKKGEHT